MLYQKQVGLLQLLHLPSRPWHIVSMNFITILLDVQICDVVLVLVDQFSMLGECYHVSGER